MSSSRTHVFRTKTCLWTLVNERGTFESVARDLDDHARLHGVDASITDRTLRRYANGEQPLESARHAMRQLLTSYFGRSVEELAARADAPPRLPQLAYPDTADYAITNLGQLSRAELDAGAGTAVTNDPDALWTPTLVTEVSGGFLLGTPIEIDAAAMSLQAVPDAEAVLRIRDFTALLMQYDFTHGGAAAHRNLLHFLVDDVTPALHRAGDGPARRAMFSAAAEVAQLLGWTAYDAGSHAAATRYFLQGLRLASEAGDRAMGGRLLANLSHQANFLGRCSDAVGFARAARHAGGSAPAAVQAMYMAMEARGLATSGDAVGCVRALHEAEKQLAKSHPESEPDWIGYFDAVELAGEAAHCFRDLGQHALAIEYAHAAIDPVKTPPRTKSFIELVLAQAALDAGNLDEALELGAGALDGTRAVQSQRSLAYLDTFRRAVARAHPAHPDAVAYVTRAREHLRSAGEA